MTQIINYDTATDSAESKSVTTKKSPSLLEKAGQAIKEFATISEIMRLAGAIGVLTSMFVFLMQSWSTETDFELFLLMLTQTGLLATAGFVMFKVLKENKSARLFFGLGLVSIAINFTVLGALFYSAFHLDAPMADYADYAHWVVGDVGTLMMATIGSVVLLFPFAYFSFSVLSRPAAKQLTAWYLGLNLLLLLPIRDPSVILVIALVVLIVLGRVLFRKNRLEKALTRKKGESNSELSSWKTLEGKFARIILFAPLLVFTLRSMLWYEINDMAQLMMLAAAYFVLRQLSLVTKDKLNSVVNGLSLVLGLFGAAWIALDFAIIPSPLEVPVFALLFVSACIETYRRTQQQTMKKVVYNLGSILVAATLTLNHVFNDTALTFGIALVSSFALLYTAYQFRSIFNIILSAAMMLVLPVVYGHEIISAVFNSGWLGLAVSGITAIIMASVLDRYGATFKLKFSEKKREFVSS